MSRGPLHRSAPAMCVLLIAWSQANVLGQITPPTTVQLPTFGIAVDADGVLSVKSYPDPDGRLHRRRLAAAKAALAADVFASSKMRKISLVRLEKAVHKRIEAGEAPDETMRHLAGLQRAQFVFYYPKTGDVILAGPAEGWMRDPAGRIVGVGTGRPVLLLDELIVALRAYGPGSPMDQFIGCTIDPDPEGLARLSQFQRSIPRTIPHHQRAAVSHRVAQGMRESLGHANIRVFGVSQQTHFAQVLIEADYRMKLIGIGLERPPVKMATFLGSLSGAQHQTLQRWWFTPNYECVKVSDDRLAMELVGRGVQLEGEDKLIGPDGRLAATAAKPNKASHLFTTAFTKKYPDIAAKSPVFAQLRNMIDLLVAAAFIRQEEIYERAGWTLGIFGNEDALPVETLAVPRQVDCAINVVWKGARMLAPAGGGVSIRPQLALQSDRLLEDADGQLAQQYQQISEPANAVDWWWD